MRGSRRGVRNSPSLDVVTKALADEIPCREWATSGQVDNASVLAVNLHHTASIVVLMQAMDTPGCPVEHTEFVIAAARTYPGRAADTMVPMLLRWMRRYNRWARKLGGTRIVPYQLPTASPWLNPIEPHWLHCKRAVYAVDHIPTIKEIRVAVDDYLDIRNARNARHAVNS